MEAPRLARSLFLLLWVALIGLHPLAGAPAEPAVRWADPSVSQSLISAPRQSLPLPVHDEATCAFCQAAAFAPHNPGNAAAPVLALGPERREILSQNQQVIRAGSARQPRSRGPPVLPNV
jgi:type IV secretory pathway VirB10-like protein